MCELFQIDVLEVWRQDCGIQNDMSQMLKHCIHKASKIWGHDSIHLENICKKCITEFHQPFIVRVTPALGNPNLGGRELQQRQTGVGVQGGRQG